MDKKKVSLIYYLLMIAFVIATTSCSKKGILSEEEIRSVLYDIYLTESIYDVKYTDFESDYNKETLFKSVLEKHNITKAQLDSSLVWYSDNPELFIRVNDSVVSMLRQGIQSLDIKYAEQKKSQNKASGLLPSYFYLSDNQPLLQFNIDSIEIFKYPNFELNFSTLSALSQDSLILSLTYNYKDTSIVDITYVAGNRIHSLSNRSVIPFQELKSIYGYFYVDPSKIKDRTILLNNVSLKNKTDEIN